MHWIYQRCWAHPESHEHDDGTGKILSSHSNSGELFLTNLQLADGLNQQSQNISTEIADAAHKLTMKSAHDNAIVTVVALITLVYLPTQGVAVSIRSILSISSTSWYSLQDILWHEPGRILHRGEQACLWEKLVAIPSGRSAVDSDNTDNPIRRHQVRRGEEKSSSARWEVVGRDLRAQIPKVMDHSNIQQTHNMFRVNRPKVDVLISATWLYSISCIIIAIANSFSLRSFDERPNDAELNEVLPPIDSSVNFSLMWCLSGNSYMIMNASSRENMHA